MLTKSKLAIALSKLKTFPNPDVMSEQYSTDSESAASILWNAFMSGDIEGKAIADFGAGTGILGIGCLLLGAKKVFFVDRDKGALAVATANINSVTNGLTGSHEEIVSGIKGISLKADVVIQNPPFGTKKEHADREFLIKAFETADVIYTFHKSSTEEFVRRISSGNNFKVTHRYDLALPLKQQHAFHKKRIHRINVSCFRLQRR